MTQERINQGLVISEKRGVPVYETNPSVPTKGEISRTRKIRLGTEKRGLVIDGMEKSSDVEALCFTSSRKWTRSASSSCILPGSKKPRSWESQDSRFFPSCTGRCGTRLTPTEWNRVFDLAKQQIEGLNLRTYQRGLRELLDHEFLFRSPTEGLFFVKIRYMFNGDRMGFAQAYHLKGASYQPELPLAAPLPALPAPGGASG